MKTQKILVAILVILFVAIIAVATLAINQVNVDAKEFEQKEYSYTKAVCDKDNACQDHIIVCNGPKVVSSTPITGAVVQFSKKWEDPRPQTQIEELCAIN